MLECVAEGEPVLINPLLDPKGEKVKPCCDGLVLCKANGEEMVTKLGINYIVKGVCRKYCDDPVGETEEMFKIYAP